MAKYVNPFTVENAIKRFMNELSGYVVITTYISDFVISEPFGVESINETIDEAWKEHAGDYKTLTEIVMIVNHLSWFHDSVTQDNGLIQYYSEKYYELRDRFYNEFEGNEEACTYYFNMTD